MVILFAMSFSVSAQEVKNVQKTTENSNQSNDSKPVFIDTGNPEQDRINYEKAKHQYKIDHGMINDPKVDLQKEIDIINQNISAIHTKMDYVKSNPEDLKVAEDKGWFDDMNKILDQLNAKKQLKLDELKKLD